ncbi:S8 family serine peptidase, partial [Streptosporangium jomthongense]
IEAGVLVCAPAGNDYGRNSLAPAILPGVLAVGAHRADGAMFFFSNYGPAYAGHGLTTLGEAVYGAHPGGGIKAQKGTCVSVALVTGAAALLVSMQRHLGWRPDPLAARDALLATAQPCTPAQAHGRPERCLNGYLDLPAAAARLFPHLPPLASDPSPAPPTTGQTAVRLGSSPQPARTSASARAQDTISLTAAHEPSQLPPASAPSQTTPPTMPSVLFEVRPLRRDDRPIRA